MNFFKVNRAKSEAPLIAIFAIFGLIMSLVFYPRIYMYSFLIFPLLFIAYLILRKFKLGLFGKQCFLILDDQGIKFCFHVLQQPKSLRWDQIDRVNFQMYEINLKLNVTGEIISFQTAYLMDDKDVNEVKDIIRANCTLM